MLATQVRIINLWSRARQKIDDGQRLRGDAGDVSATVIMIAILCTLAIGVGAIIVSKVTSKAESIPTQ